MVQKGKETFLRTVRQGGFGEYEKRMSEKRKLKDLSKVSWNTEDTSNQSIQTSALIRIADAIEPMAQNYIKLQKDAEFWKQEYYSERNRSQAWERSAIAYKAHFTRLKNKLQKLESEFHDNQWEIEKEEIGQAMMEEE